MRAIILSCSTVLALLPACARLADRAVGWKLGSPDSTPSSLPTTPSSFAAPASSSTTPSKISSLPSCPLTSQSRGWTYLGGNHPYGLPDYGFLGVANPSNYIGNRVGAAPASKMGTLYLFGGNLTLTGDYNAGDLWKFDGLNWTWMSGGKSTATMQSFDAIAGSYGTKGVASPSNRPPARVGAASWIDNQGRYWLFGGFQMNVIPYTGFGATWYQETNFYLNDLWMFDGQLWTWMGGTNEFNSPGNYGTKGAPRSDNLPRARESATSWSDNQGNFWLFGGVTFDSSTHFGRLNDLWKFDGNTWTWMAGSDQLDSDGVWGKLQQSDPTFTPTSRYMAMGWTGIDGHLWLFGGNGVDPSNPVGIGGLADLWQFDGSSWSWMGGTLGAAPGFYGARGVASAQNAPGARSLGATWVDRHGRFWLFGGYGLDDLTTGVTPARNGRRLQYGHLNDLWMYDGKNWTWEAGSPAHDDWAGYGTRCLPDSANTPGPMYPVFNWLDNDGNLILYTQGEPSPSVQCISVPPGVVTPNWPATPSEEYWKFVIE